MTDTAYLPSVEWEAMEYARLECATQLGKLPECTSLVKLSRTDDYKLIGAAVGKFTEVDTYRKYYDEVLRKDEPGTVDRGSVIESRIGPDVRRIEDAVILDFRDHAKPDFATTGIEFEASFRCNRFTWEYEGQGAAWMTEWYLNGPRDEVWRRHTTRESAVQYDRIRGSRASEIAQKFRGTRHTHGGADHLVIENELASFIVQKVPSGLGPSWSQSTGIEYAARADGTFVDADTRTGIAELVGFLFGRRLIPIGSTTFDAEGRPIAASALPAWGSGVRDVCEMHVTPPVNISRQLGGVNVEDVLGQLLPKFLELRTPLRLGEALWRLWLGNEAPLGINLPIYSAGLDMIAKAWFKSNKSKSRGVYLPKQGFDALLKGSLESAEKALVGVEFSDRILRKMSKAYETTGNERTEWFFGEIGLQIGDRERAALKARNLPAHGGDCGATIEEIEALIQHRAALSTLFSRTVLKLLGYSGKYLDRGATGLLLRDLDDPPQ